MQAWTIFILAGCSVIQAIAIIAISLRLRRTIKSLVVVSALQEEIAKRLCNLSREGAR